MKGGAFLPIIAAWATPFLLFTLIIFATGVEFVAWQPPLLWTDHFGVYSGIYSGSPPAYSSLTALTADNSDLYVAGFNNRTGANYRLTGLIGDVATVFLGRYDLGGHELWMHTIDNNTFFPPNYAPDPITKIAVWSNVYIAANINGSSLVEEYDRAGNRVWISQFDGHNSEIVGVSASSTGVYAVGYGDTGAALLQKYSFDGNLVWNETIGPRFVDVFNLSASSLGTYVSTTQGLMKYDQNGHQEWVRPVNFYRCYECISNDDVGIYVANSNGTSKYATDGSLLWNAHFQFPLTDDSIDSISITADSSGVYAYMRASVEPSNFLAKYDVNGRQLWSFAVPIKGSTPPHLTSSATGVYLGGSDGRVLVEEFGTAPSLIFIGINPPWSFVALSTVIGAVVAGLVLSIRRSIRKARTRQRAVRPRGISTIPGD